jgi:hypothetical protein
VNIDPWIVETAADNRFVSFDGPSDYLPEMVVSRIPAQNPAEVTSYVAKIEAYEDRNATPDGEWQSRVVYLADDKNNYAGDFHALSDDIRWNWLPSAYASPTVYYKFDASVDTGAEMRAGIKKAFDDSAILVQWFGHASRFRWGGEVSMWNIFDPPNLSANSRTPFVAAYSCWDGYFHNIDSNYPALAERHLLQAGRGSIGGLSPSGKHIGSALSILGKGLTKGFFQDHIARTGDAVDAARLFYFANSSAWHDVIDTSIQFGDPVLELRLPLAPAVAPQVTAGYGSGSAIELTWNHLGPNATYPVWRGSTPYFDPGAEGVQVGEVDAVAGRYVPGDPVSFTDDGLTPPPAVPLVGDPANNYFWVVRGSNELGASGESNRVGEFDFALVKGEQQP